MKKSILHVIGLALGTALLMAFIEVVNPLIPIFKAGKFPGAAELYPALAAAIGEALKSFVAVAALYAGKIRFLGSSQQEQAK
jgi:hypothetical protein